MTLVTERSVEIPWCFARLRGQILDIGSTDAEYVPLLPDNSYLLDQRPLKIAVPKTMKFLHSNVIDIPLPDETVDTVLCLSTYEHFGMEHEPYGTVAENYQAVADKAQDEMWRVLRPGGRLLLTLPFGKAAHYGWIRQWDMEGLAEEFIQYWADLEELEFFRLFGSQYVRSTYQECVEDYDMHWKRARAVVCMMFEKA